MSTLHPSPENIRERLAFDIERLRKSALRLEAVDKGLQTLKHDLAERARKLADGAKSSLGPELFGDGNNTLGYAKAQAIAELARRSALGEVLRHEGRLSLIAAMAVSRWIAALEILRDGGVPEVVIKGHVDAGRIAHRMLRTLRPKGGLRAGCGQITAAVVVAEFVHADNYATICDQIDEGLYKGRKGSNVESDDQVITAVSCAIRAGADLLDQMAEGAEPSVRELLHRAEHVEAAVEAELLREYKAG